MPTWAYMTSYFQVTLIRGLMIQAIKRAMLDQINADCIQKKVSEVIHINDKISYVNRGFDSSYKIQENLWFFLSNSIWPQTQLSWSQNNLYEVLAIRSANFRHIPWEGINRERLNRHRYIPKVCYWYFTSHLETI